MESMMGMVALPFALLQVYRRMVKLRLTANGTRVLGRLADVHRHELAHAGPQLSTLLAQIARAAEGGPEP